MLRSLSHCIQNMTVRYLISRMVVDMIILIVSQHLQLLVGGG